jgi:F0F1-type ATP synthase membrane subunit b/b'
LTLTVNVGMGATDPALKLGKFLGAVKAYGEVSALNPPNMDMAEIGNEIFGLAGYRDGRRFMVEEEENAPIAQVMQQAQAMVQQAQQELAQRSAELDKQEQSLAGLKASIEQEAVKLDADKTVLKANEQLALSKIKSAEQSMMMELQKVTSQLESDIAEVTRQMSGLEVADGASIDALAELFARVVMGQERINQIISGAQ